MPKRNTKKNLRRKKRLRKTRTRRGSGLSLSKTGAKVLAASSILSGLDPSMSVNSPFYYENIAPSSGLGPFQQADPGAMMVHTNSYLTDPIKHLIGDIRQQPKPNVYISDDKVLKTYDDIDEFLENEGRAVTASENSYGPQFYGSGGLPNGKFYTITKKLNPVKNLDELTQKEKGKFFNQLSEGLKKMHKIGNHTHGDIHMGNVLYDDTKDGRKYVWNDFDKGVNVAKTKTRRKLGLKIELKQLKKIRPSQIDL